LTGDRLGAVPTTNIVTPSAFLMKAAACNCVHAPFGAHQQGLGTLLAKRFCVSFN